MESVLQGSLRHFPVGELLTLLGVHGHTGTLEIQSRKRATKIVFDAGTVVWSESTDPAIASKSDAEGASLDAQVERVILDLFAWTGGQFKFSAEPAASAKRVTVDAAALVSKGADQSKQTREALSLYPDELQRFNVVEDPTSKTKISLSPDEFKILMKIGDGKSLEDLCEELSIPCAHLYPIVKNLHTNGLIRPIETKEAAKKVEEPPKAAEKPPAVAPRERKEAKDGGEKAAAEAPSEKAASPKASADQAAESPEKTPGPAEPAHDSRPPDPSLPVIGSLTADGEGGEVFPLIDDEHTLGRDSSNSIPIVDGSVSGKHARIYRTPEGFRIEDLKSRNGTFVNGEKVTETRLLGDNVLIRFGKVILMFNIARESGSGQTIGREN